MGLVICVLLLQRDRDTEIGRENEMGNQLLVQRQLSHNPMQQLSLARRFPEQQAGVSTGPAMTEGGKPPTWVECFLFKRF